MNDKAAISQEWSGGQRAGLGALPLIRHWVKVRAMLRDLSLSCALVVMLTAGACVTQGEEEAGAPPGSSDATAVDTRGATEAETEAETETSTETETETETETGSLPEVEVQYIEVAASDYKLELDPPFDAAITEYSALADGPDIAVYVDVIVDADVEGVLVNDVPATLNGFRTWRSLDTEAISPTSLSIEVLAAPAEVPIYSIAVTVP